MFKNKSRDYKDGILVTSLLINLFFGVMILLILIGVKINLGSKVIMDKAVYDDYSSLKKVVSIRNSIKKDYYIELTDEQIAEGIVRGMLEQLPDGYSRFYNSKELEIRQSRDSGKEILIGITIDRNINKQYVISDVDKNKTAYTAGILPGDILLVVNDVPVNDETVQGILQNLRTDDKVDAFGKYMPARIKILRGNTELDFEVERREYVESSVSSEMIGDIGYIKVTGFIDSTYKDFKKVADDFKAKKVDKVILDLRNNRGGFVNEAVNMAGSLVGNKVIYNTSSKGGDIKEHKYKGKQDYDFKLVVLINENSASASELLVGALKSYGRATLIGNTTFGKGIIQTTFNLPGKEAFQITTSEYLLPNKEKIHKIGIEPDVFLDAEDDEIEKAKEILNK